MSSKEQEATCQSVQSSLARKTDEARSKFDPIFIDFNIEGSCSKNETKKKFKCKYCENKFSTLQALGGHQNAHRRERAMEKREKSIQDAAAAANLERVKYMLYPYSSGISRFPVTTTTASLGKTLGFDATMAWLNGAFGYGHSGWSNPAAIANQQAALLQQVGDRGFQSLGMTNVNGQYQPIATSITANGNHQDGSSDIDLSLKL